MTNKLKEEFLELLDKDKEFRYTVAGYLGLSEILKRLDKLEEGQNKLWESQNKLWDEVRALRESQNKLWAEVKDLRITQNRLVATLDRLTISVEEESLDVIRHRLKNELGLDIELNRIFINSMEINIYGAIGDIYVIGEATVRLGARLIGELEEKIEIIRRMKPDLVKTKMIKVVYTDYATPSALDLAREHNIWVLNWRGDLTPRKITEAQ
ncbi:MAG: hypothetical protein HA495_03010 [Thaumarchaeota archaeon]|nr:hypothetical protein [Nitrososphaerota archaeon]